MLAMLGRSWLGIGAIAGLALLGLGVAGRAGEGTERRWGWAMLALSFVLAGPLLVARFNLDPDDDLALYVCQRFYMLPALLLAIPFAVAVNRGDARIGATRFGARGVTALLATVGLLGAAALSLPYVTRIQSPALERYLGNMLHALPPDAVVFLGRDEEFLGIGYLQWARGDRQDVTVVAHQLAGLPWYAQRIAARGVVAPAGEGDVILRVIDGLLASGRPVFVEKARTDVIAARRVYPYGTLLKVLPPGQPMPPLASVITENEALYARFVFGYERPGPHDEFATAVHQRYAGTWITLAKKLDEVGDHVNADRVRAHAAQLAPHR